MGRDLPDTFEGDMILSKEQALAAKFGMDVDEPIGRGGAMVNKRWPGCVFVYAIDETLGKYNMYLTLNNNFKLKKKVLIQT